MDVKVGTRNCAPFLAKPVIGYINFYTSIMYDLQRVPEMDESGPQRSFIRIKQGLENMLVLASFFISWEDFAVVQIDKFVILVSLNGVEFLQ